MSSGGPPGSEDEALGIIEAGEAIGVPTVTLLLQGLAITLAQPRGVARETRRLAADTLRILAGKSDRAPAKGDRRFADPAWSQNPAFRRLCQEYLSLCESVGNLVDDLDLGSRSWQDAERARFVANIVMSAAAPTNVFVSNPAALKRAFDTGGVSVARGARQWWRDVRTNGGMPAQTDRGAFSVGTDLAVTPGAVVDRDELAEVIQYKPSTPAVRRQPVLVIPPPIGRYYFLDLRPGRSFTEYAVSRGLQVFMISWRNPDASMGGLGMDAYAARIRSAMDTVSEICESPELSTIGFCAGGILMSTVLAGSAFDGRVRAASFAVTLLDFDSRAALGAFSAPRLLELARRQSSRSGVITGRQLGNVFSWMRPDDLVFNYWVSNYLMGDPPPVFDILAWNADSTNLPARLHAEFLDIFQRNTLCQPGGVTVLGSGVDLRRITIPTFVTGAITDHLTPWKGCYRTTELVGGPSTFVLSNAGHIASLVNPPGNPKATYYIDGETGAGPDAWFKSATKQPGTWWEVWADWTASRSGSEVPVRGHLGSAAHPVLEPAPGRYVRDRV
ncbi:MAG TPA: alpha/beta fold hydrolase [Streptosporangiaceae bacterium]|nr:alpha/beta fold hydrolase [Streptosporangiaceae bacterium]